MKTGGTVNNNIASAHVKTNLMTVLCAFFVVASLIFIPVAPLFASEEIADNETDVAEETSVEQTTEIEEELIEEFVPDEVLDNEEISDEEQEEGLVPEEEAEVPSDETELPVEEEAASVVLENETEEQVDEVENTTDTPSEDESSVEPEETPDTSEIIEVVDESASTTDDSNMETDNASSTDETEDIDELENSEEEGAPSPTEEEQENDLPEQEEEIELVEEEQTSDNTVEEESDVADEDISEVPEPQVYESVVFNDENKYQFSKDQCVSMGDGSFYCMEVDAIDSTLIADGVYAERDSEGDKEIFVKHDGEATQITDNAIDDDAPYFDEVSNTIVWHGLLDGRQQIFVYDIEEQEIEQITDERYNNVHPTRHGDITVWQGWVGSDWEIILDSNGEFTMVTDNDYHDISPSINGNHIIWQSFEDNVWLVKIYDITTGVIETISDSDGGSVENPRFVLVYDTKFDNGDVETKGYDIKSGESVPLSATPTQLPPELPDPEPTEEERALVTPTTQIKKEDGAEGGDADSDDDLLDGNTLSEDDVVVTPYLDDLATSTDIESPIVDVVVTPYVEDIETDTASTTDDEVIEDIIIEPIFDQEIDNELEVDSETASTT